MTSSSALPPWEVRSPTIAAMLNPAMIALLVSTAAWAYARSSSGKGIPPEFVFLLVPLVVHRRTREELPGNTNSHLTKWITDRPIIQAGFPNRARGMVPFVREGLRYGMRVGQLRLGADGLLYGESRRTADLPAGSELESLVRASALLGRWLAKVGNSTTIFALFGVKP